MLPPRRRRRRSRRAPCEYVDASGGRYPLSPPRWCGDGAGPVPLMLTELPGKLQRICKRVTTATWRPRAHRGCSARSSLTESRPICVYERILLSLFFPSGASACSIRGLILRVPQCRDYAA